MQLIETQTSQQYTGNIYINDEKLKFVELARQRNESVSTYWMLTWFARSTI